MPFELNMDVQHKSDSVAERVKVIVKCMRRLWPKYDDDLDQLINQKELIINFIQHSFDDAQLYKDF